MILGITAAAAILVGTIYSIVKAYNEDADAAKEAKEQAEAAAEAATQATEEYEKLANAFEKYDKGIKQLKDLTAGTEEYNEALKSANEAAMELIEADNSLAKYATKKNGLITFVKDDGTEFTQDELLASSKAKMNSAKAASSLAQANANRAQQKLDYTNFLRDVDLDIDDPAEIVRQRALVGAVRDMLPDVLHHLHHLDVRAAVLVPLQGTHGRGDGGIGI